VSATSRALRSTARLGTQRQSITLVQSYQRPLAAARTLAPRTRWYSSETDASKTEESKNNGEEAKKEGEEESPESALKKQLEAKDAEIRDLKVGVLALSPSVKPAT
jgi:molecular chaperone GrpE